MKLAGILTALAIILLLVVAYFKASLPAHAHSWYSGQKDPVFSSNCCGGSDCAEIDARWVEYVEGGVRIRMTVAQAQTVNPSASQPIDAFVPRERIQPSKDISSHACIYPTDRGLPRAGIICFFEGGAI